MRKPVTKKHIVSPDPVYKSVKVAKFINHLMLDGKKNTAQQVVYDAFDIIKKKEKAENPLNIFETAF